MFGNQRETESAGVTERFYQPRLDLGRKGHLMNIVDRFLIPRLFRPDSYYLNTFRHTADPKRP